MKEYCETHMSQTRADIRCRLLTCIAFHIGTAWRDWELMLKSSSVAETDPFRLTTHTELTATLIEDAGFLTREMISMAQGNIPENQKLTLLLREATDRKSDSKLPGSSRHAKLQEDKIQEAIQRFVWGIGGVLHSLLQCLLWCFIKLSLQPCLHLQLQLSCWLFQWL